MIKGIHFALLLILAFTSFRKKESDSTIIIQFRVYVHGEPLQMNKKYKNPFGETFEISRFRFYIGRLAAVYTKARPEKTSSTPYYLIDFSDSASTRIELPVTAGYCNGIEFQLGIDSADQQNGAQTGVLDPARGMFWTWNSGYQSFKIEGSSRQSDQPANLMAYHIGGYRSPFSTVWKIRLSTTNDETFRISKGSKTVIEIPIELDNFFQSPMPLRIIEIATCTTPGEMARKISENFVGSFTGLTLTSNP